MLIFFGLILSVLTGNWGWLLGGLAAHFALNILGNLLFFRD